MREALAEAHRDGAWLAAGPIRPGIRLRADDDILRIGNAAGEAHPIVGEGMSMALQSAWLLCAHLLASTPQDATNRASHRALAARYAAEWRGHFAQRLVVAATFAHLAMRPGSAWPLMALARQWPALLTAGARLSGKHRCAVDIRS
ncbi:MAG: hypothetical protein WKG52_16375 [Variovorax sp.]